MPARYSDFLIDVFVASCDDFKKDALAHGARIEKEILDRKLLLEFGPSINFPDIEIPKIDEPDYFAFSTGGDGAGPSPSAKAVTFLEMTAVEMRKLRAESARLAEENKGLKAQVEELADALNAAGHEIDALCAGE